MSPDTWLDAASFAGIAVLAVPVWSLNRRKRALSRLPRPAPRPTPATRPGEAAADALVDEIRAGATGWVNDWRPIDDACLRIGYALLLGSSFLRIWV